MGKEVCENGGRVSGMVRLSEFDKGLEGMEPQAYLLRDKLLSIKTIHGLNHLTNGYEVGFFPQRYVKDR